ncbi:alpha/beta fold hydrolase [Atopomonas sediminilitoris]|uniref:alpha/beta fold hydrolase n=1 Tax=Atopomonas sediminilitoris TaxID=2919919 RepID=UPI001F4D4DD4|nr:alpha/beta fold hydrolase [Atopomonas sediminilitoris]MCJ8170152.1 alpha/beta hydrolase [Atopomonas sediminilitoris]
MTATPTPDDVLITLPDFADAAEAPSALAQWRSEERWLPLAAGGRLFVQAHVPAKPRALALLLHGMVEDGRIFYSQTGKGLAPFLAERGVLCHSPDLRLRGRSEPALAPGLDYNQTQAISEDVPALLAQLQAEHPDLPLFIITHSWGGVLAASALARFPEWRDRVRGLIHFAAKRVIASGSPGKRLAIDLLWDRIGRLSARLLGRVPAKALGIGAVDEPPSLHADSVQWMRGLPWRDHDDGFDYAAAAAQHAWPASLYFAGRKDRLLGRMDDVRAFARELGPHDAQLILLGKSAGCSRDYGHNDQLTHPQAHSDHFPLLCDWMAQRFDQ